ncbi:L-threonylcarbamoyladenylate synthase [Fusobacterium sp. PH5-44]|uniref:L-threonylcarbamoyladenylate synthase n=1 Tax=unclassified Fusobacterium TaxID=2648384 RepID=UPI003D200CC2
MKEFNETNISLNYIKKAIQSGKTIIYPTDTVYGLGATMDNTDALEKLYKIKERNFSMPLIALVDNADKIGLLGKVNPDNKKIIETLIAKYWPGSLTIIIKKKENIPNIMVAGKDTIGIRLPNHSLALEIIKNAGGILPTTSANISGESPPTSYKEVSEKIKNKVDIIVDGGQLPISIPSTIIDVTESNVIKILRKGMITIDNLTETLGKKIKIIRG